MTCPSCGAENRADGKFCFHCGAPLAQSCSSCGTALRAGARFCDECGSPVTAPLAEAAREHPAPPAAERRLVSVLFADLVGFTTLSESRDAEEVRDLLSRYFEECRQLISRYGGTVEKFIGDAVMAVWGTPVAQEDDAERAVRAALDLVDAVAALGEDVGAPALQARAGVLSGEAAVTLGAEAQGMVAGDLVNTASRIQASAQPGTVLVGESTRRLTEAAIFYENEGPFELKGKTAPIELWRAVRVVAKVGGGLRSTGLEAPFAGRDRELRLIKELFHESAENRRARLVSVVGTAGIGKSRLTWEFYKYIDGLAGRFRWHRGRCLAYGEGVTYWALAEMVRTRAGIVEGEEAAAASAKLQRAVEASFPDPEERRFVEPRLAHLLGLEERTAADWEDLCAAWRLFYERLSDEMPTVMVFEDIHWADASLLDFIEYLLDWSRDHPLFVLTLSRPDLLERRPTWGSGKGSTALYLDPLPGPAMEELLDGLVPGLPDEIRRRVLERAQGVPLYAMETVRMLLDRGLLVREENGYRPAEKVETLEVPETLHALIASRLDGLSADERRLVQDASVLGKTFTKNALATISGLPEAELEPLLSSLVRKEVLSIQADPLSPERGQYGFLQDLVKHVAYETLSRKERKSLHLAAAEFLEGSWGSEEEEIIEVVASHYLEAYRAAPDAPDASEIKRRARDMLARAGRRAASLAASGEAQRYFEQAADLADEPALQAELLEQAGQTAWRGGAPEEAARLFQRALGLFEKEGLTHAAARVSARLGVVEWRAGRLADAVERMERAFGVLSGDEADEDLARLAAELGRLHYFKGDLAVARERTETALDIAESLWLPEILSEALNTYGIIEMWRGRLEAGFALVSHALTIALDNDLPSAAIRSYNNLGETLCRRDRYEDGIEQYSQGIALGHKVGFRGQALNLASVLCFPLSMAGRWDEVVQTIEQISDSEIVNLGLAAALTAVDIHTARGDLALAERLMEGFAATETSADVQDRTAYFRARAAVLAARGDHAGTLRAAQRAIDARAELGIAGEDVKLGFVHAFDAALGLGDLERAEQLVREVEATPRGALPPFLRAQSGRWQSRLAIARGEREAVEPGFKMAAGAFRELGVPFYLAITLLEHGEWLAAEQRGDEAAPLLAEAREIFERLGARPYLERLDRVREAVGATP